MRLKYRIWNVKAFMSFAFYPITSIAICIVTVVILDGILGKVMLQIGKGTVEYDILFAIVSIIIELSNNYKENKMSWIMLREYYNVIIEYEVDKSVLMRTTYFLEEEQQAIDEYIARGGKLGEEDKETPMDIIEATWNQLSNIKMLTRICLQRWNMRVRKKSWINISKLILSKRNYIIGL